MLPAPHDISALPVLLLLLAVVDAELLLVAMVTEDETVEWLPEVVLEGEDPAVVELLELVVCSGGKQAADTNARMKALVRTQGAYGTSPQSWRTPLVCASPLLL